MKNAPIENLLRPPVEWVTAVASSVMSVGLWTIGEPLFSLPPLVIQPIVIGLLFWASWRFYQGYQIKRYRYAITHQSAYRLTAKKLPVNHRQLFLGKGFRWQVKHTQRFYALQQKYGFNQSASMSAGNPAIHGIEPHEKKIFLPLHDRIGHTLILGTTRVGKTRLLEMMIRSDIRRGGSPVIVIDPKGDVELLSSLLDEAKQSQRQQAVRVLHLGYPQQSARYNPIGRYARVTEVASRVTQALPSQGEAAAFKEFAWRFVNTIASALDALGETPTYRLIHRYLLDITPLFKRFAVTLAAKQEHDWQVKIEQRLNEASQTKWPTHRKQSDPFLLALIDWLDQHIADHPLYEALKTIWWYEPNYFQKITLSLAPLFAKLTSGDLAALLSPDPNDKTDQCPIIDWMTVIREQQIVYVGLDALSDSQVANSVGHALFADFCSALGTIYKFGIEENVTCAMGSSSTLPIHFYADEFNELASDELITLANKGGGAGLQLTVATQTASDVIARLGDQAKARQLFGNFNHLICLRVLDSLTAQLLVDKLPQRVTVQQLVPATATQASQHQRTSVHNADHHKTIELPLVTPDVLMQLPKGHAFCLWQGCQLFKVRFPLLTGNSITNKTITE